jgi:NAD(P)H dehydrogenase (quinone)
MAEILISPDGHIGKVYQLTGPQSLDSKAIAQEYSKGLGQTIQYQPISLEQWENGYLMSIDIPEHVRHHLATMISLHRENHYDRMTEDVEKITGIKPQTIESWVHAHSHEFR